MHAHRLGTIGHEAERFRLAVDNMKPIALVVAGPRLLAEYRSRRAEHARVYECALLEQFRKAGAV